MPAQSVVVDRQEFVQAERWLRRGRGVEHDLTLLYKDEQGLKARTELAETILKSAGSWPQAIAVNGRALSRLAAKLPKGKEVTLAYAEGALKVGPTRLPAWTLKPALRQAQRGQKAEAEIGARSANASKRNFPAGIEALRYELTHDEMLALADVLEGWMLDPRVTTDQAKSLDRTVDEIRALAVQLGPFWRPIQPSLPLSLLGFLGKQIGGGH